ncbi:hypothetical protein [Sulfurimonas sp.]|jgi:hypothetical protein|uniref:hypothetical protein n=1 Tax=Sulfurimonas sp. TaxID=2022749 RepID=UPI0025F2403B|nr:hypothetical protein [Sulfurimonas sp.]MBT5934981.1 hypothetical protein [Sulfurimonas sp.]
MKNSSKAGRLPIEITDKMIQKAQRLSELGLNEKQISESLGISYSTFQRNKEYFEESLKKGKSLLRERITTKLLEKVDEGSETSLIFISKRLGLFNTSMGTTKAPKAINEAIVELANVYEATALGDITELQGDKFTSMLLNIIKSLETVELEDRINKLEEVQNEGVI